MKGKTKLFIFVQTFQAFVYFIMTTLVKKLPEVRAAAVMAPELPQAFRGAQGRARVRLQHS